jgi:hypothetical protein
MTPHELTTEQAGIVDLPGRRVPVSVDLRPAASTAFGRYGGGWVQSSEPLPVGVAMHLEVADGHRCLVVIVDDSGMFVAAGPIWDSTG